MLIIPVKTIINAQHTVNIIIGDFSLKSGSDADAAKAPTKYYADAVPINNPSSSFDQL